MTCLQCPYTHTHTHMPVSHRGSKVNECKVRCGHTHVPVAVWVTLIRVVTVLCLCDCGVRHIEQDVVNLDVSVGDVERLYSDTHTHTDTHTDTRAPCES